MPHQAVDQFLTHYTLYLRAIHRYSKGSQTGTDLTGNNYSATLVEHSTCGVTGTSAEVNRRDDEMVEMTHL